MRKVDFVLSNVPEARVSYCVPVVCSIPLSQFNPPLQRATQELTGKSEGLCVQLMELLQVRTWQSIKEGGIFSIDY